MDHNDYLRGLAAEEAFHSQTGKDERAKQVAAHRKEYLQRCEDEGLVVDPEAAKPPELETTVVPPAPETIDAPKAK